MQSIRWPTVTVTYCIDPTSRHFGLWHATDPYFRQHTYINWTLTIDSVMRKQTKNVVSCRKNPERLSQPLNSNATPRNLPKKAMIHWMISKVKTYLFDPRRSTWIKSTWITPKTWGTFTHSWCTGLFQPCDVGIQRVFKHSLKRSYHSDVVLELSKQLAREETRLVVDKRIGVLRDRSITWLWDAFTTVNKPDIVKKVSNQPRSSVYTYSRLTESGVWNVLCSQL